MQILRWILLPLSFFYSLIIGLRNIFYARGIFTTYYIPIKSIVVGNLSTGGTGKTPHVAFLAELLKDTFRITILSRGYGRSTNGFLWVKSEGSSSDFGDEPLTYARRFNSSLRVAVCEKRKEGIERILTEFPETNLILLDDAFQHRAVTAGMNILLTDYSKPFYSDVMLPSGNLREPSWNKNRADMIIVTKCPENLTEAQKIEIKKRIDFGEKPTFFSKIVYGSAISFGKQVWKDPAKILLITGIANAQPLIEHLSENAEIEHIEFKDHYDFSIKDIQLIQQKFDTFATEDSAILTTEKDFVRLMGKIEHLKIDHYPWFYLPISVELDNFKEFKTIINQYVETI